MAWENDCARSVREIIRALDKVGHIGVGIIAGIRDSGHSQPTRVIEEKTTRLDDEVGVVKREAEKMVIMCKMDSTVRAAVISEVESMHKSVHRIVESWLGSWDKDGENTLAGPEAQVWDSLIGSIMKDSEDVKNIAAQAAIHNIATKVVGR